MGKCNTETSPGLWNICQPNNRLDLLQATAHVNVKTIVRM